jgi:hypothetical protein
LWQAIDRYAVVVFPGRISTTGGRWISPVSSGIGNPRSGRADVKRRLRPEMSDISNLDEQGRLRRQ